MTRYIQIHQQALSPQLCENLINGFNEDNRVQFDPQPDYSTRRYLFLSDKLDWRKSCLKLSMIANEIVDEYFDRPPHLAETRPAEWIDDGYVMACYDPGAHCALHTDGQTTEEPNNGLRLATLLFFLNNVPEGGELYFPIQDLKVTPEQGKAIIFPPGFHHPHEVFPPATRRYVVQTWITDPDLIVKSRQGFDSHLIGQQQMDKPITINRGPSLS